VLEGGSVTFPTEAEAARNRLWSTWKIATRTGRKVELWVEPETAAAIEARIADGTLEHRTLRSCGRVFHQFLRDST
jgi:hypothetical protein